MTSHSKLIPLGELCEIKIGGTPSRDNSKYFGGNHIWVSVSELNNNVIVNSKEKLTDSGVKNSNVKLVKKGSILLSFKLSIGKKAIAGRDLYTNEAIASLTIKKPSTLLFDYLYNLINFIDFSKYSRNAVKGKVLNLKQLKEIPFPVPSITIQEKIVSILQLKNSLSKKIEQLKKNNSEFLLAVFSKMFNQTLERKWEKVPLQSIVKFTGGGTPSKKNPEYYTGTIPWVTPKDMKKTFLMDSKDHITEKALNESATNLIPPENVILVVRSGILKKTLPVAINLVPVTINQDMKAFSPDNRIEPYFLLFYLKSIEKNILKTVRSTTAHNLSTEFLRNLEIPIPPKELQLNFTKIVKKFKFILEQQKELEEDFKLLSSIISIKSFQMELMK